MLVINRALSIQYSVSFINLSESALKGQDSVTLYL